MDNAGDPKQVRRAQKLARIAEREDRETITQIMSTKQGRAWMLRKLEAAHIFSDPFTGDALKEAFLKGERNFGLQIFGDIIRIAPDTYIQMMRERNERDSTNFRDLDNNDPAASEQHSGSEDANGGIEAAGDEGPRSEFD